MFKSALEIIKADGVKRGAIGFKQDAAKENGISFATHLAKDGRYHFVVFRIGREIARKAGLRVGDTALFGLDVEKGMGQIYASKDGWKLVTSNPRSDNPALILRATWKKGYPSIGESALCSNALISNRTITFKFPKGTSFGELAKKGNGVGHQEEKEEKVEENDLYEKHREIVEKEERINKKTRKAATPTRRESDQAPRMKDGKPYGRRATDD